MKTKSHTDLIDKVCKTQKMNEKVREAIPILIHWAKQGGQQRTYGDLNRALGYENGKNSSIGYLLGEIDDVLEALYDETGEKIPTLNALVISPKTKLPSSGFKYVEPSYDDMTPKGKAIFIDGLNKKAIEYKNWDWVLSTLGLNPYTAVTTVDEQKILSGKYYGKAGEGKEHKALKEYIFNHPEKIGLKGVLKKEMEYVLLSADRIDVYFELKSGEHVAVEVKPKLSPSDDILRGLYQCVKYKAVLDAQDNVHGNYANNRCILVLGGELNKDNESVRAALDIEIYYGFDI